MSRYLLKSTILCLLLACTLEGKSQFYLGLSANIGNNLKYTPASPRLENPPRISGSLIGIYNEILKNNWALQYNGALGVLGYNMKVTTFDTLTTVEQIPDSPQTGTVSSKGDFWCVDLGIKYPISNFW